MTYPIAELFHSLQGEGHYTGTPMFFIRLAGCNVGKYEKPSEMKQNDPLRSLRLYESNHSICTTADGQRLLCDTDYYRRESLTPDEILNRETQNYRHVVITGGEPFLHDLQPLLQEAWDRNYQVHIETSGTLPAPEWLEPRIKLWITCSPKVAFLDRWLASTLVDEWKFLVGPQFNEAYLKELEANDLHGRPIYIQPIGSTNEHNNENIIKCLDILRRNPTWKLSAQLHKYLALR